MNERKMLSEIHNMLTYLILEKEMLAYRDQPVGAVPHLSRDKAIKRAAERGSDVADGKWRPGDE